MHIHVYKYIFKHTFDDIQTYIYIYLYIHICIYCSQEWQCWNSCTTRIENITSAVRWTGSVSRPNGGQTKGPPWLLQYDSAVKHEGVSRGLMIPRDISLSDSYTPGGSCFPVCMSSHDLWSVYAWADHITDNTHLTLIMSRTSTNHIVYPPHYQPRHLISIPPPPPPPSPSLFSALISYTKYPILVTGTFPAGFFPAVSPRGFFPARSFPVRPVFVQPVFFQPVFVQLFSSNPFRPILT